MESPPSQEPSSPPSETEREGDARRYEAIHNRLFLVRVVLTLLLVASYLFSGASAQLAEGLRTRFGDAWWLVNGLYMFISFFAFSAMMFPLTNSRVMMWGYFTPLSSVWM